jgi:hypothetical protein
LSTTELAENSPEKPNLDSESSENSSAESPTSSLSPTLENLEALPLHSLHKQFTYVSRGTGAQLQIITQPEQQHRARYQTEGSRGAVKDRSGNGFPIVKLNGYDKPTTLQVNIDYDQSCQLKNLRIKPENPEFLK